MDQAHPVGQAMVRNDVWNALLSIPIKSWRFGNVTVETSRQRARVAWDAMAGARRTTSATRKMTMFSVAQDHGRFLNNMIPFSVGTGTSFGLVLERESEMTDEQVTQFVNTAGEFAHVTDVLATTRYMWRPSYPSGPQYGDWECHAKVLDVLRTVVRDVVAQRATEQD